MKYLIVILLLLSACGTLTTSAPNPMDLGTFDVSENPTAGRIK